MKKLYVFTVLLLCIFQFVNAQDVRLIRTSNEVVETYIYMPGDDTITYLDVNDVADSAAVIHLDLCAAKEHRVLVQKFTLNVKSTSISKIVLIGSSSDDMTKRSLSEIKVGNTLLVEGTDYYTTSDIYGKVSRGTIIIDSLNIPQDTLAGTDVTISIASTGDGSGALGNIYLSEIVLSPISVNLVTIPVQLFSFRQNPMLLVKQ